ncbi:MAG: DUF1553 domain-containing protein [Planctomycetota bacterium]|nr:DUF1553 domain-containing protein [Planctomycetota bacterium]
MRSPILLGLFTTLLLGTANGEDVVKPSTTRIKVIDFDKERKWWSYAPILEQSPPQVIDQSWCKNDIDRFILAKLETIGLSPAPQANRVALIRRAFYDITGLPPSPEEVDAFVRDTRPQAWSELIDRLLASPHYGERWGRYWLDLVRYADTNGFERDSDKPGSWRYRDWVIAAFNNDKPYDRFLTEQLAGDELPDRTFDTMVATGYYRLGMWDDEVPDIKQALADDLDGIVDTTARTMLGMGIGCARCHDHKGDPIRQSDYYAFAANFAGLKPYKTFAGNGIESGNVIRSISTDFGVVDYQAMRAKWREQRSALIAELLAIETSNPDVDRARSNGLTAHYAFETKKDAPEEDRAILKCSLSDAKGKVIDLGWGKPGRFGLSGSFDGGDDRVSIPSTIGDDFTISFWFNTDRFAKGTESDPRWFTGTCLVDDEIPGIVDDFGISIIGGGVIAAGVGNPETFVHSAPGFNDGQWHHVALTRSKSSGEIILWIDGLEAMRAVGGKQTLKSPKNLMIGGMLPGGGAFTGMIDEVRLYDRVLDQTELISMATSVGVPSDTLASLEKNRDKDQAAHWRNSYETLKKLEPPSWRGVEILCAVEQENPQITHVLTRGSPHAPAGEVQHAVPEIAQGTSLSMGNAMEVYESESSGRRFALAKWITDPSNQFTSRVMANRIWQHHFDRAICPTPNDFGHFGELPTHPELLDWLAKQFVASGWSMKEMHRLIMKSATYQMSSNASADALAKDPANENLSHFRLRRLQSEEVRDTLLAVNGSFNPAMGGPGIRPPMPEEVLATSSKPEEVWPLSEQASWPRRSVYIHAKRSLQDPLLAVFDQADIDNPCPVRFSTIQPTQALTMLNSKLTNEQAIVFADRIRREYPNNVKAQVERAMRLAYGRAIEPLEIDEAMAFLSDLQSTESMSESDAMNILTLAIYNSNEFMYVD